MRSLGFGTFQDATRVYARQHIPGSRVNRDPVGANIHFVSSFFVFALQAVRTPGASALLESARCFGRVPGLEDVPRVVLAPCSAGLPWARGSVRTYFSQPRLKNTRCEKIRT